MLRPIASLYGDRTRVLKLFTCVSRQVLLHKPTPPPTLTEPFRLNWSLRQQTNLRMVSTAVNESSTEPSGPLKVKRLSEHAFVPTRGSKFAAGYDLYSAYETVIPARGKLLVKTDIAVSFPYGLYARVAPRSGLAHKNSIDVGAGVIDFDYRGNVGVILFNHSDVDFTVKRGDRIAQLILERIYNAEIEEVNELDETERAAGGFGSTGVSIESPIKKMKVQEVTAE